MDEKFIKEHAFYKHAHEVQQICESLISHTPINYFCLIRVYKNGDYGILANDKEWAYEYLKNDYQNLGVEHQIISQISGSYFWNLTTFKPIYEKAYAIYDSLSQFKHGSGVFLIDGNSEYKDACIITTPYSVNSNDPYLIENIPLLKSFVLYFKEKIYENKELYTALQIKYKRVLSVKNPVEIFNKPELTFPIKKYHLGGQFYDVSFSKREAECLKYLFHGKTAKQIAKILNLSPRTVETYFEQIKLKSNSSNLQEVCRKLESCALLDGIL